MRSSKSRSRSKSNRQRSMGNVVNRVFDSSGPEGKVRGTPQQIIDKYLTLARDAQLGNDRVAEQNFLQHAEHYTRMLGEAQREMAREQEARQAQQQAQNKDQSGNGQTSGGPDRQQDRHQDRRQQPEEVRRPSGEADVIDTREDEGSGLVETPEARGESPPAGDGAQDQPDAAGKPEKRASKPRAPRSRAPRKPKAQTDGPAPDSTSEPSAAE